jgi:hypothetical protein
MPSALGMGIFAEKTEKNIYISNYSYICSHEADN